MIMIRFFLQVSIFLPSYKSQDLDDSPTTNATILELPKPLSPIFLTPPPPPPPPFSPLTTLANLRFQTSTTLNTETTTNSTESNQKSVLSASFTELVNNADICENGSKFIDLSNIPGKSQQLFQKSYYCECKENYFGDHCERFNENGDVTCLNSGIPLDGECLCTITAFSGKRCEILTLPPCLPNPCNTVENQNA